MTKGVPEFKGNEIAVKIAVEIPDSLFDRPSLSAVIKIPEGAHITAGLDVEVIENVQDIILTNTGFDVKLIVDRTVDGTGG